MNDKISSFERLHSNKNSSRQDFIQRSTDTRISLRKQNLDELLNNKRLLQYNNNTAENINLKYEIDYNNLESVLVQEQKDKFKLNIQNIDFKFIIPHINSDNIDFVKYGLLVLRKWTLNLKNLINMELYNKDLINQLCHLLEINDNNIQVS